MEIYKSRCCVLTEIRKSGKKDIGGILVFKGISSPYGSGKEVVALEDGVVLKSGRNADIYSREHRLGTIVTMTGREGVNITYGRLASRCVNEGDCVRKGEVIGIEGSSGTGQGDYLTVEFRRNGRRVDGCEYLGIPCKPAKFMPPKEPPRDVVCRACGLSERMRQYIDSFPDATEIWSRIFSHIQPVRE